LNLLLDLEILGWLLAGLGLLELCPLAIAWSSGEPALPYVASALAALAFGVPLALSTRGESRRLRTRDGFLVVSAAWALATVFGGMPYVLTGTLGPVDAIFEAASGFTTTGSTVLQHIEAAPRALLFWRALTQWVGGMGIIVFTVAVLPMLGIGGMQLFKAEVPGPVTDKLTPRIVSTARRLWLVYVGITAAAFASLMLAGLGPFDAVCHAFTTLATGGFSTRQASAGAYHSPAVEWVLTFFMLLAGMNFVLHYRLLSGGLRQVLQDTELRLYLAIAAGFTAAIALVLVRSGQETGAVRTAAFQVVSLLTTTGYATADYELWPPVTHFLVLCLFVLGGMAGSTAGGLKTLRVLLGLRSLRAAVTKATAPHAVQAIRYAGRPVPEDVVAGVGAFFMAYFALAALGTLVVAACGYDLVSSLGAALTTLGNVGPGLGAVGPSHDFSQLPAVAKGTLTFCMIAGRLEVFTVLVLFDPRFWRH